MIGNGALLCNNGTWISNSLPHCQRKFILVNHSNIGNNREPWMHSPLYMRQTSDVIEKILGLVYMPCQASFQRLILGKRMPILYLFDRYVS